MEKELEGKAALVTGASRGLGKGIALKLAEMGASVAINYRSNDGEADNTVHEIKQSGGEAESFKADVSDSDSVRDMIRRITGKWGKIDILVNNAGITQRSLFRNTRLEVYRRIMDVNFFGTLHSTKPALESLIARKGVIVVTTSIAGIAPLMGRTGYSASKHALHGFFESLRTELADYGVHVMMLCPYFTVTNLQDRALNGEGKPNREVRSLVGKQATVESVADAVYRGVMKRKPILVLTFMGKLSYFMSRLFPRFYEKKMSEKIRPEFF